LNGGADITGAPLSFLDGCLRLSRGDAMSGYEAARANMIERQLQPNRVTDPQVIAAFAGIRRELFVPAGQRGIAYSDTDLPLGDGRYLMAPMVAARLVQAAEISRQDNALVVGAGVGYEAALIALLARSVVAFEEDAELARQGRAALVEHRIAAVKFVEASASRGNQGRSAYEVIFFAGAVAAIPAEIAAQLLPPPTRKSKKKGELLDQMALSPPDLSEPERAVFKLLSTDTPLQIDTLAESTKLSITQLTSALLALEMRELIRALPGMCFVRKM